mmetsp:Transcript_26917/g.39000  ORF Transcript_26917/g.39000 Transcript_26917/m.39000 type:complete len:410 (-) Transcript_26917:472-1701(-)
MLGIRDTMPLQQSQKKRNSILILSTVTALCFLAIYTRNRPQSIDAIATDYFPETADQRLLKWGMPIPEVIEHNLADINEPFTENETPLFFHIPKSGGSTAKQYYGVCMHLVTASQNGIMHGHDQDEELQIVNIPPTSLQRFVNVDVSTPEGLQRASYLGFGRANIAEVMFSPYLFKSAAVFEGPTYRGRAFGLFRDPVDREVSRFYYRRGAEHEVANANTYLPELNFITIAKYSLTSFWEGNAVVRMLADLKENQKPTYEDLELAMEIVRRKILVGLMDHMEESIAIFDQYFGFQPGLNFDEQWYMDCRTNKAFGGANHNTKKKKVDPESGTYKNLARRNRYDRELYSYVVHLFETRKQLEGVDMSHGVGRVNGRVYAVPNDPIENVPPFVSGEEVNEDAGEEDYGLNK